MSPAQGIVKMKPYCRNCGTPVPVLRRCPKCGRRNWSDLLKGIGARH